ncbi:leucine--tRNA ligase [Acidobacteriota bacterium]
MSYDFKVIEAKWQHRWEQSGTFRSLDDLSLPKYYVLIEFPYPSGDGLHVGHPRSYTALDVVARKRRMEGFNVLYPMGWDAFGLPTENYAIRTGRHPQDVTRENVDRFRRQLKQIGISFDWSREVNTTDPAYYKWTQWIFLKMWEHDLAYKAEVPINWCTSCKVGLANEEVVGGRCERCKGAVIRKRRSQWMLKITAYADRLLDDLETVDYLERIKTQQIYWIGKSQGAEVDFTVAGREEKVRVFTTRPDTLFGATYMVLSPEHPYVEEYLAYIHNPEEVRAYVTEAARKSEFERADLSKEATGVELKGLRAINPVNQQEIPIWVADYVLITYGTGAIMCVPGHDARDWRFARKFNLPIVEVIAGGDIDREAYTDNEAGTLVNSDFLNGLQVQEAIRKMTDFLIERNLGKAKVNYKLRDWVFSRQRYWGEPIPMVYCEQCRWVPLPEDELPLLLPEVESYQTTQTGDSPLSLVQDWVNTSCPKCSGPAKRETDTMPNWAGSCWYFLRYIDPRNDQALASQDKLRYWCPVDWYNGGMEHTTLHVLYSRFWYKFLYDIGVVPTSEPYKKRTSHGMILGEDSEKMSKSRGNVLNPDDIVEKHGADSFRIYEMFMGAFEQATPWSTDGLIGMHRFLHRVWQFKDRVSADAPPDTDTDRLIHKTIRKVDRDIEAMKFNTAVAALMELANHLGKQAAIRKADYERFVLLMSPFTPHVCEELWALLGHTETLARKRWPEFDEERARDEMIPIVVQINGKKRDLIQIAADTERGDVLEIARKAEKVRKQLEGKEIKKEIYVPNRLVNFVVQ